MLARWVVANVLDEGVTRMPLNGFCGEAQGIIEAYCANRWAKKGLRDWIIDHLAECPSCEPAAVFMEALVAHLDAIYEREKSPA